MLESYIKCKNISKQMQISFFEEFPQIENLAKIKLIKFPTKLYLAAENLSEFEQIKKRIIIHRKLR